MNEFRENNPAWKNYTSTHAAFKEASEAIFIFDFLLLYNLKNEGVPLDASSAGTHTVTEPSPFLLESLLSPHQCGHCPGWR